MTSSHPIVAQLVALDTLKTWSLIATLFGDLDGKQLSGTQIRTLLGHIKIKPEAIRVALHRLKSEGWIVSTKQGREAIYELSARALDETQQVADDVYSKTIKYPEGWQFEFHKETPSADPAILLTKNLILCPASEVDAAQDILVLSPQNEEMPQWIEEEMGAKSLVELAASLLNILPRFDDLTDVKDKICFRLLVLHHWRRIALRNTSWAHASLFPDGQIAMCHSAVTQFLEKEKKISPRF